MKKLKYLLIPLILGGVFFTSCKKEQNETVEQRDKMLTAVTDSVKVDWIAYKTNERIPVKGHFNSIRLTHLGSGTTPAEIMENAEFEILGLDLNTGDEVRDSLIVNEFFGNMANPGKIKGKFIHLEDSWFVDMEMNGVEMEKLPITFEYRDDVLEITTTINVNDFDAMAALNALNKVCFEQHIGPDGNSVTWDEVDVEARLPFVEVH